MDHRADMHRDAVDRLRKGREYAEPTDAATAHADDLSIDTGSAQGAAKADDLAGRGRTVTVQTSRRTHFVCDSITIEKELPGQRRNCRLTSAATPAAKLLSGMSRVTTDPAAIMQPLPMVTPPKITLLAPIQVPSPTTIGKAVPGPARRVEAPSSWLPVTKATSCPISHLSPISI